MTPEQAIAEAKKNQLRPVYLVLGEEQRLQSDVLSALRSAALAGAIPGLNDDQWVAGEVDVNQVLGAARTLPMLSKLRVVVVRSLERWEPREGAKSKDEPLDKLADYVKAPVPSTLLVLLAGKLDKRRRLVTTAQKEGCVVLCEPLARAQLPGWVERRANESGNRLAPGVADLIAELAGPDLAPVSDAIERLCLYAGAGNTVSEEHVAECLVRLRTASVWQLVDAVGQRDVARALAMLHDVYDPEDRGIRLVGVLAWSARQLVKFEGATRAGLAPEAAAQRAGAPPFKARDLARQVQRIPREELERWLETLAGVDLALKGGSKRPPKAVLEHAIIALCSSSAPRRAPSRGP
jgi:DNA polymerase III subunit delta